jgi:hypothetical protein
LTALQGTAGPRIFDSSLGRLAAFQEKVMRSTHESENGGALPSNEKSMMHKTPPPELHVSIWRLNVVAKGKEAIQTIRWPLWIIFLAAAAFLFTIAWNVTALRAHILRLVF